MLTEVTIPLELAVELREVLSSYMFDKEDCIYNNDDVIDVLAKLEAVLGKLPIRTIIEDINKMQVKFGTTFGKMPTKLYIGEAQKEEIQSYSKNFNIYPNDDTPCVESFLGLLLIEVKLKSYLSVAI